MNQNMTDDGFSDANQVGLGTPEAGQGAKQSLLSPHIVEYEKQLNSPLHNYEQNRQQ